MIVFSPPRCDFLLGATAAGKQTTFTTHRLSLPLWAARPASSLVALRSLQANITPQPATPRTQPESRSPNSTIEMSTPQEFGFGSPRSPFSPTLNSIPEVFEYEPLDEQSPPATPNEKHVSDGCRPEPPHIVEPRLSMARTKEGIITSPRRAITTRPSPRVSIVLRKVLDNDRVRRRRVLRIYLKAMVFLKMLVKSHERYGALMATQGTYMQR